MTSKVLKMSAGLCGAFIAAVLVGVLLSCGYAAILVLVSGAGTEVGEGLLFIAVNAAYVSVVIALPTVLILALPHVMISSRLHRTSITYYLLSGIIIGLIAAVVVGIRQNALPGPPFHMGMDQYFFVFSAATAGAISALAFWKVARPDMGTKKP